MDQFSDLSGSIELLRQKVKREENAIQAQDKALSIITTKSKQSRCLSCIPCNLLDVCCCGQDVRQETVLIETTLGMVENIINVSSGKIMIKIIKIRAVVQDIEGKWVPRTQTRWIMKLIA